MAGVDKLIKALENLRVFSSEADESANVSARKKVESLTVKDKVINCNSLADGITSQTVRTAPQFPHFLGVVIETLLSYTNDKESDVRMVADECLNRITKVLLQSNLGRLQVEFYKELKKNGPSRCVRSALWRFAELAPLIRPQKRRAFVVNLLPCVVKMAERHEEALQECLLNTMGNICSTLMKFATDAEIKAYVAPFLHNLCSTSAAVRRVASTCITHIIQHSRQPLAFFNWLLLQLLDVVLPVMHTSLNENTPIMLGCLQCIRLTIPHLTELSESGNVLDNSTEHEIKSDTSIMLFELIIHSLQQSHPSIVTAALECLQQLLKTPLPGYIDICLTPGSMVSSVLAKSYEVTLGQREAVDGLVNTEMNVEDTDSTTGIIDDMHVNLTIEPTEDIQENLTPHEDKGSEVDIADNGASSEPNGNDGNVSSDSGDQASVDSNLIGSLTDSRHPPLLYATRLICHTFLLTGANSSESERLFADRDVRVSIKSLAMSCLAHIVLYYPECLNKALYAEASSDDDGQLMSDILLYRHHSDPQLQGAVALTLGNLIHASLTQGYGRSSSAPDTDSYFAMLLELLSCDNSIALRQILIGVRHCLNTALISPYLDYGLRLLKASLEHRNHNYWLVKVEILELISEIDIPTAIWTGGKEVQPQILDQVVLSMLSDGDYRVRQAAASALVRIVPNLFYAEDHQISSIPYTYTKKQTQELMYPFLLDFPTDCPPLVHGLATPYSQAMAFSDNPLNKTIQSSLSRVIFQLIDSFSSSSSQNAKLGVIHALQKLSEAYPVTRYSSAWSCAPGVSCLKSKPAPTFTSTSSSLRSIMLMDEMKIGSGGGPLNLVLSLITSCPLSLELSVHQDLLSLAGNLFSGACYSALRQSSPDTSSNDYVSWPGVLDRLLIPIADKLLSHLCKLLNIFAHAMEENSLTSAANPKAVLDAAKEAITSPIKKRVSAKPDAPGEASDPKAAKESDKYAKKRKEALGSFHHLPFYLKLYDSVKGAHLNYKVSLSLNKLDKFSSLVGCVLSVMSQLLEVASLSDIGKYTEEILEYLKIIVNASPIATIYLVHQLLKALFGTNLSSQFNDLIEKRIIPPVHDKVNTPPSSSVLNKPGIFTASLSSPYADLAQSLAHNPFRSETDDYTNTVYVIKKCLERKMPSVLKPASSVDKVTITSYIRMFESLVIKSLKMYTLSSSVQLQIEVLSVLVQLIQIRVNYCLLDNDEVFLGYVIKQIDMISEGPPSEQAGLIRCIFQLLLLLSYEKLHSKTLVVVPRIIQLCDGVMASGQNPSTHAIPALEMLVQDLFLARSLTSSSTPDTAFQDIETQREVAASMLLRLITHQKILRLVSVVLYQTMRENEDKWKKLSRQVIDLLLPLATKQKVETETREGLLSLHNILLSVSPSVYRPVDMLLISLFTQPQSLGHHILCKRWISGILAILRVLLQIGKEEVILSRLNEIEVVFDTASMTSSCMTGSNMTGSHSSLISSSYGTVQPQEIFASFLVQVIAFCVKKTYDEIRCTHMSKDAYMFSLQQLSTLLLYTAYIIQSGHFRKVSRFMMEQLQNELSLLHHLVSQINEQVAFIGAWWPIIAIQWSNLIVLLNFNDQTWWKSILQTQTKESSDDEFRVRSKRPLNQEIMRCGGLAAYCDFVVENLHDAEHMTWLIVNHVNDIIELVHETPVQDLLGSIYSNPSASSLFISAVQSRCRLYIRPSTLRNLLMCLRNIHKDQSGALLVLLVDKLLTSHQSCINRLCESLACRRVEVLLAEDEEVVHRELTKQDLQRILETLKSKKHRYRRLLSLVEKLQAAFYPDVAIENKSESEPQVQHTADKNFYLHICQLVCCHSDTLPSLSAALLGALEMEEIVSVMTAPKFQMRYLPECIKRGCNKTIRIDTGTVISDNDDAGLKGLSPLFLACEKVLCQYWSDSKFQSPRELTASTDDMTISVDSQPNVPIDLIQATCAYLNLWSNFDTRLETSDMEAVCNLCFNCLTLLSSPNTSTSQLLSSVMSCLDDDYSTQPKSNGSWLTYSLELLYHILRIPCLIEIFAANDLHVSSALTSVLGLIESFTEDYRDHRQDDLLQGNLRVKVNKLITYLTDEVLEQYTKFPPSFISLLKSVITGLCRLPSLNKFVRLPPGAVMDNDYDTCDLRAELLQDTVVLQQFIKRNNLLGWISRQQFEETWACLLHLLSPVAAPGAEDISQEEDVENIEWLVSALRGITAHLCKTLLQPQQGNTLYSCYRHSPRHKAIPAFYNTKIGHKLHQLRVYLSSNTSSSCSCRYQIELLCANPERKDCFLWYNQLSIDYLATQIGNNSGLDLKVLSFEKADSEKPEKDVVASNKVDTTSCLKLLIDVFTHLLSPSADPKTPLMLINECIKAVLVLSDLFTEQSQFEWMFLTLMDAYHHHQNGEDELANQYLILGLCKSASITHMTTSDEEKLVKMIDNNLRSLHIPSRLAAVNGCLYLLESSPDGDLVKMLLSPVIDYVLRTFDLFSNRSSAFSEIHSLCFWSLAFYLLENYLQEVSTTPEFTQRFLHVAIQYMTSSDVTYTPDICRAVLEGFERLLLTNSLGKDEAALLLKFSHDRLSLPSTQMPIESILGLMTTCLYADLSSRSSSSDSPSDPDLAAHHMEITSLLFDRIRRGLPAEAELVSGILPPLMLDLLSSQDIMNKVIGEFLSEQQSHPALMARMIYEVFEQQQVASGDLSILQDWVLLSLNSFIQRKPLSTAIWSLNCCFLCASDNHWLKGLFPFLIARIGMLDQVDIDLFLLSSEDFYNRLNSDTQQKQFIGAFQSAARHEDIYKQALTKMKCVHQPSHPLDL